MAVTFIIRWVKRPQLLIALLVAGLVVGGLLVKQSTSSLAQQQVASKTSVPADLVVKPDCSVQACIALTFDDGPDPIITPQVLDILKRHNARATFFMLGYHVPGNEAVVKRIHQEGHEIGNHSWAHAHFTQLTPEQIQGDIP